jgi:hypothetical protein
MKSRFALTLVLLALLAGCGSPWKVVKRPTPSTLAAARTFSVKPLDFSGVSIDGAPEPAWRAAAGDAKSKWWDKDKEVASRNFMRMITSNTKGGRTFTEAGADADANASVIVLKIGDIHSADFQLTLQVTTAAGDVIEEATMTLTIRGYGVSEQIRGSGKRMADAVVEYIAQQ